MADWIDLFKLNTIAPYFIIRAFKSLLVKGADARGPGATSIVINISSAAASTTHVLANNIVSFRAPCKYSWLTELGLSLATAQARRRWKSLPCHLLPSSRQRMSPYELTVSHLGCSRPNSLSTVVSSIISLQQSPQDSSILCLRRGLERKTFFFYLIVELKIDMQ